MMLQAASNLTVIAAVALAPMLGTGSANAISELVQPHVSAPVDGNKLPAAHSLADRFRHIRSLQEGWAGAGSVPVVGHVIEMAIQSISIMQSLSPAEKTPAIAPCADGSLQIEWYLHDSRFEMYFETDGSYSAWWQNLNNGREIEAEGKQAELLLARWAVRKEAWPVVSIEA